MTAQQLAFVLLRVLGVFWGTQAIIGFPGAFSFAGMPGTPNLWLASQLSVLALAFIFSLLLIIWTKQIVDYLFPASGEMTESIKSMDIQSIAFSVVGLLIIGQTLPTLIRHGFEYFYLLREYELDRGRFGARVLGQIASSVLMTLLGVALFLGSKGLARFWHNIRPLKN